jgi:AGCS family alanine or glycine:cation symporter
LLLPAGIVFTIKTKFLPIRLFPDMVKALTANNKNGKDEKSSLSSLQTLIVSTATRVGMGNLTGVRSNIRRWSRGRILDVDHSIAWIIDSLYRSNSCTVT